MTHSQASLVASYLNRIYTGPEGVFCRFVAFSDKRTCEVDSEGRWCYYVASPFGAYLDGKKLSPNEEFDAIADAMEVLVIA